MTHRKVLSSHNHKDVKERRPKNWGVPLRGLWGNIYIYIYIYRVYTGAI